MLKNLESGIDALKQAGATVVSGGQSGGGAGFSYQNTLLTAGARQFLENPEELQQEAFGNSTLLVVARPSSARWASQPLGRIETLRYLKPSPPPNFPCPIPISVKYTCLY